MLKNILLPPHIQSYYLFSQTIVGINIGNQYIDAVVVQAKGKSRTIIHSYRQPFEQQDSIEQVIQAIIKQIGHYDEIICNIPNNLVVFKELKLTLKNKEKIKLVLNYELESSVPFKLSDASSDFIILQDKKTTKETLIYTAIAQQQTVRDIEKNINIVSDIPKKIIPNALATYAFLQEKNIIAEENWFLLDVNTQFVTITHVRNGILSSIRTITKKSTIEAGADTISFFKELAFTIQALAGQEQNYALLYYDNAEAVTPLFLQELAKIHSNVQNLKNISKAQPFERYNINTVALAYPTNIMADFTLLADTLDKAQERFILRASAVALGFILLTTGLLVAHNYFSLHKIRNEVQKNESFVKKSLQENFKLDQKKMKGSTKAILRDIAKKVNQDESIWFAFSKKTKFSYLKYLQELSSIINIKETGLKLERLSFTEKSIIMKGAVPDFDSLDILMNQLHKSPYFIKITTPQETTFSIELTFDQHGE